MLDTTINIIIDYGPLSMGLLCVVILIIFKTYKKKSFQLEDIMIVFLSGASIPTAGLLILGGFDKEILVKLLDNGIYIALSGLAILYIGCSNLRSRFK